MDTLFGAPAHVLLIHAPIVLLPVAALATIVFAVRPAWRSRAGWWMVGALAAVVAMVFAAKESGEALDEAFDGAVDVTRHAELADTTFVLTLLWFAVYAALIGYEFVQSRRPAPASLSADAQESGSFPFVTWGLATVSAVLALLAAIWLIRAGHEGVDVVWGETTDVIFGK